MKSCFTCLAALVLAGVSASLASAQYPPVYRYPPQAPDACGPGYYYVNPCGMAYGPNYCLRPCWCPFNGALPCPCQPCGQCGGRPPMAGGPPAQQGPPPMGPVFPAHPYARSPRDFFMTYEDRNDPVPLGPRFSK